jgi:hypothetical protein
MPDGGTMEAARAALDRFRALHGIDERYDDTPTWPFRIGPVTVQVPNFSWRKAAIQRHDIHHLVTGYPFNMRGEFQVATWEFAAGRYPHAGATLLILPLVVLGFFRSPGSIWRAFVDGRRSRSLYRPEVADRALHTSWEDLLSAVQPHATYRVSAADRATFAWLVLQSAALVTTPIVAMTAAIFLL